MVNIDHYARYDIKISKLLPPVIFCSL